MLTNICTVKNNTRTKVLLFDKISISLVENNPVVVL